jgi:hypothetical protein
MGNLKTAEDLTHFVSVTFLTRIRISKLQAPENPIKMLHIQLIVLSVWSRQMLPLDPAEMKIMYKNGRVFWPDSPRWGIQLAWMAEKMQFCSDVQ